MKTRVRRATMTNKERVEALLRRERPDRVPQWPFILRSFSAVWSGRTVSDAYADNYTSRMAYEAEQNACRDFDWVFIPSMNAPSRQRRPFGGEVKLPTNKYSQSVYVTKYAADTPEEVMALKAPDVRDVACITPEMMNLYEWSCRDKDKNKPFNLSFGAIGVMNQAAGIAGYDKLCKWMIKEPEVAHRLIRLATDYQVATAQYYKDTFGVDGLLPTGANAAASNQLISPKQFEQFALPYLKEAHEKVLAMGFKHMRQHFCGDHNLNLPYWQQIPMGDPGIIYIANEVDLETAAKYFPNDIIQGNLDTAIVQCGTPDEVYEAARKVIEQGKSLPNGFIFNQACELPPMSPIANVMAMTRALNDFGWYD